MNRRRSCPCLLPIMNPGGSFLQVRHIQAWPSNWCKIHCFSLFCGPVLMLTCPLSELSAVDTGRHWHPNWSTATQPHTRRTIKHCVLDHIYMKTNMIFFSSLRFWDFLWIEEHVLAVIPHVYQLALAVHDFVCANSFPPSSWWLQTGNSPVVVEMLCWNPCMSSCIHGHACVSI